MRLLLKDDSVEWDLSTIILVDGSPPYTPDAFPEDGLNVFDFEQFTSVYDELSTYFSYDEIVGKDFVEISKTRNVIFETVVYAFEGTGFTIRGSGLLDTINASAGDDILYDLGPDRLRGGAGNDTYYVSNVGTDVTEGLLYQTPFDFVDTPYVDFEKDAGGIDQVFASISYVLTDFVENLYLEGATAGTGNGLANQITGDAGANIIRGLGGDDRLIGGAGNDILEGGTGSDTIVLSGRRADYSFATTSGGSVSAQDLREGAPDGTDSVSTVERIEFEGGDLMPAQSVRGTFANDVFVGTSAQDIFFFDSATGISQGADTVRHFGIGDRIVTTTLLSDPNGDGIASANSSDRFSLLGPGSAGPAGTIKVFSDTGVYSHLKLASTQVEDGVTFFVYANMNDQTAVTSLAFI